MNTIIKLILLNLFISKGLGTQNNKTIDVVAVGDMMILSNALKNQLRMIIMMKLV